MARTKTISDTDLLRHAREVFLESGVAGSTKEIARRAGISEAAVFQRFPTKAALFLAAMLPPEVDVSEIVAPMGDVREGLTETGRRMLVYFRTLIPMAMHLMTNPAISMEDVAKHFRISPPMVLAQALSARLDEAAADGKARTGSHMAAASLFVSAVHSLAAFEVLGVHGDADLEHAVPLFATALWEGLRPETPSNDRPPATT